MLKWKLACRSQRVFCGFSALQRAEIAEIQRNGEARRTRVGVSVLFNEPKLLKSLLFQSLYPRLEGFSALQRAEIAEIVRRVGRVRVDFRVSVLFNEPKLLKSYATSTTTPTMRVSVLFNEPKLLKCRSASSNNPDIVCFSALQRAEIAEI